MDDDYILAFLVQMTAHVAQLHAQRSPQRPQSNAGPRYNVKNEHTIYDEGFSRWMGWRGEDAQEREMSRVSPEELKAERLERSRKELLRENRELKRFLCLLRDELVRRVGKGT